MENLEETVDEFSIGDIFFSVPVEPASLQANRTKKDVVTNGIREAIKHYDFILTGDVQIDIKWFIHQQKRYETHLAPDVDNIIKPILDAMCGPNGVLVNDCQVQSVACSWIDWTRDDEKITIRIRPLFDEEWIQKQGLVFVRLQNNLCFPWVEGRFPETVQLTLVELVETMRTVRDQLIDLGIDYYQAQRVMPIQRMFHVMHVRAFEVIEVEMWKASLK